MFIVNFLKNSLQQNQDSSSEPQTKDSEKQESDDLLYVYVTKEAETKEVQEPSKEPEPAKEPVQEPVEEIQEPDFKIDYSALLNYAGFLFINPSLGSMNDFQDSIEDPVKGSIEDPVKDSIEEPVQEPEEPVQEPVEEPVQEPEEPVQEPEEPVESESESVDDILDNFYYEEDLLNNIIDNVSKKLKNFDDKFQGALERLNKFKDSIPSIPVIPTICPVESDISDSEDSDSEEPITLSEFISESEMTRDQNQNHNTVLQETIKNRKYGFIRSTNKPKQKLGYFDSQCYSNLKNSVDLRAYFPTVYDQGHLGSCTSNAIAGAFNYYIYILKGIRFDSSRLFIYYNERTIENSVNFDNGATLEDGMKSISENGVCPENDWPYDVSHFREKPPVQAYKDAEYHKCHDYAPIEVSSLSFKLALSNGFPVIFGFNVYESFETLEFAQSGIMPMPKKRLEKLLGGHAVLACGFDDKMEANGHKGFLLVRNSWGPKWGLQGYFWMPYDFIDSSEDECADCWVIGAYDHDLESIEEETITTCSQCDTDEECKCSDMGDIDV